VLLALALPVLHADIGENFAKGVIALSGSISFFNNFSRRTAATGAWR